MGMGRGMGMGMGRGMGANQGATSHGHQQQSDSQASPQDAEDPRATSTPKQLDSAQDAPELKGRDIVAQGKMTKVEGTLKQNGHEWQVISDGKTYNIHLGPEEYRTAKGITFGEGVTASVTGFAVGADIAVCSLTSQGKTLVFRNEDGRPAWSGSGRGRNHAS
jgi:hypothetical protein